MTTAFAEPELQQRDLAVRSLAIRAETVDDKARSVEAVLATENPVEVLDLRTFEKIDEILLMSGVDLPAQLPLLEDHMRWGLFPLLGSTHDLRVEGSNLVGRVVVASGPEDSIEERAWRLIRQGHLTDVSVGYKPVTFVDIEPGTALEVDGRTYTANDKTLRVTTVWKPRELSLTIVGADDDTKLRSARNRIRTDRRRRIEIVRDLAAASGLSKRTIEDILGPQSA